MSTTATKVRLNRVHAAGLVAVVLVLLAGCGGSSKSSSGGAGSAQSNSSGSASTSAKAGPPSNLSTKIVALMAKSNPDLKSVKLSCPSASSFPVVCQFKATAVRTTVRSLTLVKGQLSKSKTPLTFGPKKPTPITGTVKVTRLSPVPVYSVAPKVAR